MIATKFRELDTIFKEIQEAHADLNKENSSELERDLLLEKLRLYYSRLKSLTFLISETENFESKKVVEPEKSILLTNAIEIETRPTEIIHTPILAEEVKVPVQEVQNISMEESPAAVPIEDNKEQIKNIPPIVEEIKPIQKVEIIQSEVEEFIAPQPEEIIPPIVEKREPIIQERERPLQETKPWLQTPAAESIPTKKNRDIKSIIDINTRFGLIQHFFKGNIEAYNAELSVLNATNNLKEAESYIAVLCDKFGIEKDSEYSNILIELAKKIH